MRKELFQRIANVVKSLNMALDAAAGEGIGVTIYTLPSFATDQDNPIVGVRLSTPTEGAPESEDVMWIGMPVPHAED
jgi:hypothetical protein